MTMGGLVDGQVPDGQARHALGQVLGLREESKANLFRIQVGQLGGVMNQVPDDQLVAVGGMLGQRPDQTTDRKSVV